MPWNERDATGQPNYAPPAAPRVRKPRSDSSYNGPYAQPYDDCADSYQQGELPLENNAPREYPPEDGDFLYDDSTAWDDPLSDAYEQEVRRYQRDRKAQGRAQPAASARRAAPADKAPRSSGPSRPQKKKPPARGGRNQGEIKPGHPILYATVITVCLIVLVFLGLMMLPQITGTVWKDFDNYVFINGELLRYDTSLIASYKQCRDYLQQDVIYPGVFIDDLHVGGMTVEEARAALLADGSQVSNAFSITVAIGNKTWLADNARIPATRDLGNVLEQAYAIGRTNTTAILGTSKTPFRERSDAAIGLRENNVFLKTSVTYVPEDVRALVDEIAAYVTRDPTDSVIESFDFKTRTFTFTADQPGVTIDADALYADLTARIDKWEKGTTLTVSPVITTATVTQELLKSTFKMIAAYTTDTTSSSNRNNNINLACQAINGTVLLPGETFSFNQATGERTIAKGYKEAGAIAAGQSIEEVGGGICQVSSTLFNAVARADLAITERHPHAWPSTYVNRGEDATVNWPNLDFKFTNDTDTPIFIITYYNNRKISAEIYGKTLGDGVSIDLSSTVVKTIEAPYEVKYVNNPELPPGTSKDTVKARTGYVVDTYKVWYQNGAEVKRELLHTSTYKAYQKTVEYN